MCPEFHCFQTRTLSIRRGAETSATSRWIGGAWPAPVGTGGEDEAGGDVLFACAESNRRSQGALRWVVDVDQKRRGFGDAGNRCRVIDEGNLSRNRETGQDEDEDGDGEDQEGAGWLALALIDAALLPGRRRGDGTMAWRRGFLSWAISPSVFGISG